MPPRGLLIYSSQPQASLPDPAPHPSRPAAPALLSCSLAPQEALREAVPELDGTSTTTSLDLDASAVYGAPALQLAVVGAASLPAAGSF